MSPFVFDAIPIPLVFLGLFALLYGTVRVGFSLGQRNLQRAESAEAMQAELSGASLAGILTLTGFLIAFTFSLAGSHFDSRRQLVIDHANAIGGAYFGTDLLQEPYRSNLRETLIEYVELQARRDDFEQDQDSFDEFVAEAEALHLAILQDGNAAANADPTSVVATFVITMNNLIDVHGVRTDLRWNRIPPAVFIALVILSVLGTFLVGYIRGVNSRPAVMATTLAVLTYAIVFTMVIDLDRHTRGIFSVSQQPIIELRDSLLELSADE